MLPADITLEKTMPFSAESERAVLRAILLDERPFSSAVELLSPDDSYDERNRQICLAMLPLVEDEKPIRAILLLEELCRRNKVEEAAIRWTFAKKPYPSTGSCSKVSPQSSRSQ